MKNIESLEMENRKLKLLAEYDALTGLLNRYGFEQAVKAYLSESGGTGSMIVMDMDRFKAVNDQYGHLAGDQLLREVSAEIGRALGQGVLARVGGDEFAAFIPSDLPDGELESLCGRIQDHVASARFLGPIQSSVSVTADWSHGSGFGC